MVVESAHADGGLTGAQQQGRPVRCSVSALSDEFACTQQQDGSAPKISHSAALGCALDPRRERQGRDFAWARHAGVQGAAKVPNAVRQGTSASVPCPPLHMTSLLSPVCPWRFHAVLLLPAD